MPPPKPPPPAVGTKVRRIWHRDGSQNEMSLEAAVEALYSRGTMRMAREDIERGLRSGQVMQTELASYKVVKTETKEA